MGILNSLVGEIVSVYKADASQAIAETKKLQGAQKEQAQAAAKGLADQASAWEDWGKTSAKAAAAATAAYAIGKAGFDEWAATTRLQSGAMGIDLDKVSAAAGGLSTRMDILKISQAAHAGAWKLTTDQLVQVEKGMRALVKEGYDQEVVQQRLTETLRKGTVEGLKDFGIQLKQTGVASVDLRAVLHAMDAQVKAVGGDYAMAGDDVRRAGVKWEDTLHGVKIAIGELVVEMGPLLTALTKAVDILAKIPQGVAAVADRIPGGSTAAGTLGWLGKRALLGPGYAIADNIGTASDVLTGLTGWDPFEDRSGATWGETWFRGRQPRLTGSYTIDREARARAHAENSAARRRLYGGRGLSRESEYFDIPEYEPLGIEASDLGTEAGGYAMPQLGQATGRNERGNAAIAKWMAQAKDERRKNRLEEMFGPVSDFDAYTTGFNLLSSAVTSAFDAWTDGQKSVGDALKDTLKAFASSLGHQAVLEALKNTAYGVAALANPVTGVSAAGYFKAAAIWTGVAVAAGATTGALSGGGGGSAASAGGYRATGGGSGYPPIRNDRPTVIVHSSTDDFDTPRSRAARFQHTKSLADSYAERSTWERS